MAGSDKIHFMKIGAHQSIVGNYSQALERIKNIGGNCLQIFSSSPRSWNFTKVDEVQATQFRNKKSELNINPIYFHSSYLINLANEEKIGNLSKLSLISELSVAPKLGIKGSIIHLGSFKNFDKGTNILEPGRSLFNPKLTKLRDRIILSMNKKISVLMKHIFEILEKTPQDSLFIIENAGNNKIGKNLDEIAEIIKQVNNPRVRVCLDTCHLHSAGYDLTTSEKLNKFLNEFDKLIGLQRLELFHINDSRDPFNSGRDRHQNIGEGTINMEVFRLLLNHPKLKHLPFIVETPGFKYQGPDKKNLDILKSLIR